jgi:peroxiredoxin Q/BCP
VKSRLPFPLLIDEGQKIGELYHTRGLMAKRTVYLIGPDGRIRYAQRGMPDADEVLASAV